MPPILYSSVDICDENIKKRKTFSIALKYDISCLAGQYFEWMISFVWVLAAIVISASIHRFFILIKLILLSYSSKAICTVFFHMKAHSNKSHRLMAGGLILFGDRIYREQENKFKNFKYIQPWLSHRTFLEREKW